MASAPGFRDLVGHTMVDFNQMKTFVKNPLILTAGRGIRVTDVDGKSYIDGLSGVFAVSLGHSAHAVVDAMVEQLRRLAFASPIMATTDRALELVGELIDLTEGRMQYVKLFGSGSEAIEAAMKMARQFHKQTGRGQRYKIISFYRSYHGGTMGALSATGWANLRTPYEPLVSGFVHTQAPIYGLDDERPSFGEDAARDVQEVIKREGVETVAAVILEPVMLTAGVRTFPRGFLPTLRKICNDLDILLIYDEIVTGFGRLGSWFAAEHYDTWPDFMCVGKGISSGYAPLSAVLMTESVGRAFWGDPQEHVQFHAGHTYAGNPVSAAAGLATIRYMRESHVLENVSLSGAHLARRLMSLEREYDIIGDVRGLGLLYALEFMQNRASKTPFPDDFPVATAVQRAARQRGLLLRASPHIATLAPPLITTEEEIDEIADILSEAIADVAHTIRTTGKLDVEVGFGL